MKKLFAFFLSLCMILSLIPATVSGAGNDVVVSAIKARTSANGYDFINSGYSNDFIPAEGGTYSIGSVTLNSGNTAVDSHTPTIWPSSGNFTTPDANSYYNITMQNSDRDIVDVQVTYSGTNLIVKFTPLKEGTATVKIQLSFKYTTTGIWGGTTSYGNLYLQYNVTSNVSAAQEPDKPSGDTVEELLEDGAVKIICNNSNANHATKTYGLIEGTYTIGDVKKDSSSGEYYVDVTVPPANYVSKYNSDTNATHSLDPASQTNKTIRLVYSGNAWSVKQGYAPVQYTVKCEDTEQEPEEPSEDELAEIFKEQITVDCIDDNAEHCEAHNYGLLEDSYSLGNVSEEYGVYTLDVIIKSEPYILKYSEDENLSHEAHKDAEEQYMVTLNYDSSSKTWKLSENSSSTNTAVNIPVICEAITVTPADITIYSGGDGYSGVISDDSGNIVDSSSHGLPEPGYYLDLPEELNKALKDNGASETEAAVNLTNLVEFQYDNKGQQRNWAIELYNPDATSWANDKNIYSILPSGEHYVRLQYTDENGNIMISDDLDVDLNTLYKKYNMSIYPGDLDQGLIKASVKIGNETKTYRVTVGNGTLTVRGTTDSANSTDISPNDPTGKVVTPMAVVSGNTDFFINGSQISAGDNADVKLLSDAIVSEGGQSEAMLKEKAETTLNNKGISTESAEYEYHYLDIVDENNGNTWLTPSKKVKVFLPYPEGTDKETDFSIVHFKGLDRDYDNAQMEIENCNAAVLDVSKTDAGIYFSTDSFSPFALMYKDGKSASEDTDEPDDNDKNPPTDTEDSDKNQSTNTGGSDNSGQSSDSGKNNNGNVKTGDNSFPIFLWALVIIASAAAALTTARKKLDKNKQLNI